MNKINFFSILSITLSLFLVVAYFGGGFPSSLWVWQNAARCLIGGGVENLPHSYHCITIDKFFPIITGNARAIAWPVKLLGIALVAMFLATFVSPSAKAGFLRYVMTPAGLLAAVSIMAGLIGALLINQQDLVLVNGLILSARVGQHLSLVFSFVAIVVRVLWKVVLLYLLTFAYRNTGKLLFQQIIVRDEPETSPYLGAIIHIALGLSVHGLLLVLLAVSGFLNSFTVWFLLLALLACGFYQKWQRSDFWQTLFLPILNVKEPFTFPILSLFVVWLSLNLLEITRPIPIGYDDMGLYINYGKNLYEAGSLPQDFGMRFWEVFTSQGFFLLGSTANAELAILLSFFGGFLALLSLYFLLKHFWPREHAKIGLLLLLFYTMPMVFFETAKDMKPDVALTFFFIASLSAFLLGHGVPKSLLGLFLGVSFSIKYTAGFFIVPIAIFMALAFLYDRKKAMPLIVAPIIFFLIPLLPRVVENHSLLSWQQPSGPHILSMNQLASKYPTYPNLLPTKSIVIGSGYDEEVSRYVGYEEGFWRKYLLRPWYVHLNSRVSGPYTDVGFIWLASLALFLPIVWFLGKDKRFTALGIMAAIYWILWIFIGRGIPWYGMSGFILIILLFGWWHEESQKVSKIISKFFIALVLFWIIIASLTEFSAFISPFVLGYASGYLDTRSTKEQMVTWYYAIGQEVNNNPPTLIHPGYVYRIGTMAPYFIKNDFDRVYNDSLLETFTPLNSEGDQYLTTLRLALLGFRYIVVDLKLPSIDQTPDRTLVQKVERLSTYINGNPYLMERIGSDKGSVIFLEIDPKLTALYRQ